VQEWLARHRDALPRIEAQDEYLLLPHCTERATAPTALRDWQTVFASCGMALKILPSGCCGMAGTWGHEAEHRTTSEHIYALSWGRHVAKVRQTERLLADGYSCRSQAKLIDGVRLLHPVQALLAAVRAAAKPVSNRDRAEVSSV
jgi:Fe-S oxidoreductase